MQDHHSNQNSRESHRFGMQAQNVDIETLLFEYQSRDGDLLSKKFNSRPFLLYKFWLIVNLIGALIFGSIYILQDLGIYKSFPYGEYLFEATTSHMSVVLLLYGCGEMLFAINQRKARAAQRSFSKFQYYLLVCLGNSFLFHVIYRRNTMLVTDWLPYILIVSPPIVHIVGGRAVLRAFKENHPLQIQADSEVSEAANPLFADLLAQNQVIASELSKYEHKLDSYPFVIYNWWLKLIVVFEISFISTCILSLISSYLFDQGFSPIVLILIGALILSFFNAYSRFEMEIAMRTRNLTRSKRAVLLLKISIVSSIPTYLLVALERNVSGFHGLQIFIPSFEHFAFFAAIPAICIVGALRTHKVIEERDHFANASNFPSESYL